MALAYSLSGSSPRMRGSRYFIISLSGSLGIIPADAGLTKIVHDREIPGGDHPRGCGAHFGCAFRVVLIQGSSPRMRGSPSRISSCAFFDGIIPADAGLTLFWQWTRWWRGDHPRGCGAHSEIAPTPESVMGSSPRMRGSHVSVPA